MSARVAASSSASDAPGHVSAGPRQMKRKEREVGLRVDDDARQCGDAAKRLERERALLGDRLAKRRRAEQLHRQPHAQARKPARQLGRDEHKQKEESR
jgi:hypothetical protein